MTKTILRSKSSLHLCYCFALLFCTPFSFLKADTLNQGIKSKDDLEWGAVLFNYYQRDYLSALIEHQYILSDNNSIAQSKSGQLLKGGMLLSYGIAEESEAIFKSLLDDDTTTVVKNSVWYYLSNLYYHKSDMAEAHRSLQNIQGDISSELHTDYHYLATLINNQGNHLSQTESMVNSFPKNNPLYGYVLFNFAISQLEAGDINNAVANLIQVSAMSELSDESATLADRARHGLAQILLQQGKTDAAWSHLMSIKTSGLYSNRALLTYAWTAIKLKQLNKAIPALAILDDRSIAIPEVQEGKVLLAHLYEQEGSPRKALKRTLLSIEAFERGLTNIDEARKIIALQNVPRELITNFDTLVGQSDWYSMEPTVDYQKLTPFLIDLISSVAFTEILRELSDLYTLHNSLTHWSSQVEQHLLILKNSKKKVFAKEQKLMIKKGEALKNKLATKKSDLQLYALGLEEDEQKNLSALVESVNSEFELLDSRVRQLKMVEKPYSPPIGFDKKISNKHQQVKQKLESAERYIGTLEPVMRNLINAELDKHEDRMRYYLAQSRLAKARLYDTTLMTLDKAKNNRDKNAAEDKQ